VVDMPMCILANSNNSGQMNYFKANNDSYHRVKVAIKPKLKYMSTTFNTKL